MPGLLLLVFIYYCVEKSVACQSEVDYPWGGGGDNGQEDPRFAGDLSDRSKHFQHWDVPPGGVDPDSYIKDWMKNQLRLELEAIAANGGVKKAFPDDAGRDWPRHWIGLGVGLGGVPPPPWAKDPNGRGRADMCYLPPATGNCKRFKIRWAYNPYRSDCFEFVYSGCDGNSNNFYTKGRCQQACRGPPKGQCVNDPDIKLHDYNLWYKGIKG